MTLSFEMISNKDLKESKLIKKMSALIKEYNRRRSKLNDKVTELEIAKLYKLLSHFDIVITALTQAHPAAPEVQHLREVYQPQICQEWYDLFHIYRSYTSEPAYSIDQLIHFARKANQAYLPRVLADKNSPIASQCKSLRAWFEQLSEIKKSRKRKETTKVILEELAIRESISQELQRLLMNPELYLRYEKELFRTLNQQSMVIFKLNNKFSEACQREFQRRAEREHMISEICSQVYHLSEHDLNNFSSVMTEKLRDYQVQCCEPRSQTLKVTRKSAKGHLHHLILRPVKKLECPVGCGSFDALVQLKMQGLEHLIVKSYAQIKVNQEKSDYDFIEITAYYPHDINSYLNKLEKHNHDKSLNLLMYAKNIMDSLIAMNEEGIYYNNIKPSNILIDQWGNTYFSQVKSLLIQDKSYEDHMNLNSLQKLSLGTCLYQLAYNVEDDIDLEDINIDSESHQSDSEQKLNSVIRNLIYPDKAKKSLTGIQQDIEKFINKQLEMHYEAKKPRAINDDKYGKEEYKHLQVQPPPRMYLKRKKK